MLNTPFSPWPCFTTEEADAAQRILLSNKVSYWTGLECRNFEKEFAVWAGTRAAIALSNGTVALELAIKALGLGPGDEVVVTPRTFIASVACVVNAGATPVFADVNRETGNIDADTISAVLTKQTRAVICVHLAGWPCDMDPIMALSKKHGLKIIEDCAQAHGARYKGRGVGSIGHIGTWSFCQDKIMTTGGEGGMVTTTDEVLWRTMWSLKDHGKSYEAVNERQHPPGFRWLCERFGTNARMTEMQAAIGRIQLRRMADWTGQREANASLLSKELSLLAADNGPVRLATLGDHLTSSFASKDIQPMPHTRHALYRYYVYVRPNNLKAGWSRNRIVDAINAEGVPCYQGICSEVYLEKAFDNTGYRPTDCLPVAHELGDTSLVFLVHPTLTETEMRKAASVAVKVLQQASTFTGPALQQ